MIRKDLDYDSPHFCSVYNRVIDIDLCYESLCCLSGLFKVSSVSELKKVKDIDKAREKCKQCPYSDLS